MWVYVKITALYLMPYMRIVKFCVFFMFVKANFGNSYTKLMTFSPVDGML